MRRFVRALILLHRTYRPLAAGARLHVLIRFLTCPFLRLMPFVPRGARLIELGAGHGLFTRLALDAGAASAVAVEPDLRKVFAAPRTLRFVAAYDDALRGTFDVVAMIDVLYAIPRAEWDPLFTRIAALTTPGGVFLLKEMDPRKKLKNGWNRLQETISIKLTRITMAEAIEFEEPEEMVARLRAAGFGAVDVVSVDAFYPHPHLLYVCRR